jgi:hypothetical protein
MDYMHRYWQKTLKTILTRKGGYSMNASPNTDRILKTKILIMAIKPSFQ